MTVLHWGLVDRHVHVSMVGDACKAFYMLT